MMLDAEVLNQQFDLLPLVEQDAQLKREGAWYIGPCPFCGGTDRFNLRHTDQGWKWFCRHCGDGKYHTAIDYIMRRSNCDFKAAITEMGGNKPPERGSWMRPQATPPPISETIETPGPLWRERGNAYIEECRQRLWTKAGETAYLWLRKRGLSDTTLAKYRIGFNPEDRFETLEQWGLQGDEKKVWLARGITIPAIGADGLYYIKTRRPIPANSADKKYVKVRGSKPGVFGWQNMRGAWLAVVTEGEFDCMILDQEAGVEAAVCTFGSTTDSPTLCPTSLLTWTITAAHLTLVFDNDEAGREGSARFQEKLPRAKILSLPDEYNDVNEMHLTGGDLAVWLCREVERLGIVDQCEEMTFPKGEL